MTKRIKVTTPRARTIRSTSPRARSVDPSEVTRMLGAEPATPSLGTRETPRIAALRQRLFNALKSTGGRPAIEGAERRQKIPMRADDWQRLESIAARLAAEGTPATPGQVASQLLHDALTALAQEAAEGRTSLFPSADSASQERPASAVAARALAASVVEALEAGDADGARAVARALVELVEGLGGKGRVG